MLSSEHNQCRYREQRIRRDTRRRGTNRKAPKPMVSRPNTIERWPLISNPVNDHWPKVWRKQKICSKESRTE